MSVKIGQPGEVPIQERIMPDIDITPSVEFDNNDDERLPITKCVCGEQFYSWEFYIGMGRDNSVECPECGRQLYFTNEITIWEVK